MSDRPTPPALAGLVLLLDRPGELGRRAGEVRRLGRADPGQALPRLPFRGRPEGEARPFDLEGPRDAWRQGVGPAIVAGKPAESPLWERVESDEMPPKSPLKARRREGGAPRLDRRRGVPGGPTRSTPIRRPPLAGPVGTGGRSSRSVAPNLPRSSRKDWPRTPVDRFVLRKLEAEGLSPRPEADRRTLIRRLRFDLTGLPPTPEEVDAFLLDTSPDAYDKVVDRLLASPDYGVRQARWWLDLARFGETNGFEYDEARPNAWRYRDWVVDAFNRDLPYDEFARLQLAGDALRPDDPAAIEATGFLVAGAYDSVGQTQQSEVARAVVRADETRGHHRHRRIRPSSA